MESAATKEIITSKIIYYTSSSADDISEFNETDEILDIYLSFQEKCASISSNSSTMENDTNVELEQNNEGFHSQFKYLEEKVREREGETKANLNNLEKKISEREEKRESVILD
ncbi:10805_t:CDS:2 [Funneliformis mosseae]|uniref:10805_t:CDS:1 n=1 Tax=Funneliformis mosseae TaxID=27381 RepID=A0A9N9FW32_FUNMO|nr:10805_t:CDS:2 [Funneliformis mosseae]